jgi:stage II sporulation protein D
VARGFRFPERQFHLYFSLKDMSVHQSFTQSTLRSVPSPITRRLRFLGIWAAAGLISLGTLARGWAGTELNTPQQEIRVLILQDVPAVEIRVNGPYQIIDPLTHNLLEEGRRIPWSVVGSTDGGFTIAQRPYAQQRIAIITRKDIDLKVRGLERKYRERLDIYRQKDGQLLLINRLGVEDYIRGVLYHESSHRWPMEALMVQAIAARTYALYQMQENELQDFDVTSDIYSQVYGGRKSERYRTNIAVKKTVGQVMIYQGKIIPAYYHSTCAGHTEDVTALWNHEPIYPLKGVRCSFCTLSPHYRWKKNIRLKDIQDKLNAGGYQLGLIKEIHVLERNASGRIETLRILTREEQSVDISGKDFRNILGPNLIKSNNYRIVMQGYYCDIIGAGWGHGVGMCQWGALGMAKMRHKHYQIIQQYYPGVMLIDYRQLPTFAQ